MFMLFSHLPLPMLLLLLLPAVVQAATHSYEFRARWKWLNPDGVSYRPVITINDEWPLPTIDVNKGDRVEVLLINELGNTSTSLHFHGLFQHASNWYDGPVGFTQCPIMEGSSMLYNFTVDGQSGTYWYHSHTFAQYSDGLRGAFIIRDEVAGVESLKYDKEEIITLSDWYHEESTALTQRQLSRYNPTGSEPIPQNTLMNDSKNVTLKLDTDSTYLLRFINMGIMVSQYVYLEDHEFWIVEVDGVVVKPMKTDLLYLSVGQRCSVLLKTKAKPSKNYPLVQAMDEQMLDTVPSNLETVSTNWVVYDNSFNLPTRKEIDIENLVYANDFDLEPSDGEVLFEEPSLSIVADMEMKMLGDGIVYALFNGKTWMSPKVPTLYTVLSAGKMATNPEIYGSNTNTFLLPYNQTVEIVLNNYDDNKHPFHLHGHNFQIVERSKPHDTPHPYHGNHTHARKVPSRRDTLTVEANGHFVLRFRSSNPGVWAFHCHLDWHLEQGLSLTLVEAPLEIQNQLGTLIPDDQLGNCRQSKQFTAYGNAAGHFDDFLNLEGERLQPEQLPDGFTFKGYIGLLVSTVVAVYALYSIYLFGMDDVKNHGFEEDTQVLTNLRRAVEDPALARELDQLIGQLHGD